MTPLIHQRHREAAEDFYGLKGWTHPRYKARERERLSAAFARFEQQLLAGREG